MARKLHFFPCKSGKLSIRDRFLSLYQINMAEMNDCRLATLRTRAPLSEQRTAFLDLNGFFFTGFILQFKTFKMKFFTVIDVSSL